MKRKWTLSDGTDWIFLLSGAREVGQPSREQKKLGVLGLLTYFNNMEFLKTCSCSFYLIPQVICNEFTQGFELGANRLICHIWNDILSPRSFVTARLHFCRHPWFSSLKWRHLFTLFILSWNPDIKQLTKWNLFHVGRTCYDLLK